MYCGCGRGRHPDEPRRRLLALHLRGPGLARDQALREVLEHAERGALLFLGDTGEALEHRVPAGDRHRRGLDRQRGRAPSCRSRRSTSDATRGSNSVPPLANAAYAFASCNGVARMSPWPTADRMLSPGSQSGYGNASGFASWIFCFHAASGTRPLASFGSGTPVVLPNPYWRAVSCSAVAARQVVLLVVVEVAADRVEVHVARHRERPRQRHPSVLRVVVVAEEPLRVGRVRVLALVVDGLVGVDQPGLLARDPADELERRARRVLTRRSPGRRAGSRSPGRSAPATSAWRCRW